MFPDTDSYVQGFRDACVALRLDPSPLLKQAARVQRWGSNTSSGSPIKLPTTGRMTQAWGSAPRTSSPVSVSGPSQRTPQVWGNAPKKYVPNTTPSASPTAATPRPPQVWGNAPKASPAPAAAATPMRVPPARPPSTRDIAMQSAYDRYAAMGTPSAAKTPVTPAAPVAPAASAAPTATPKALSSGVNLRDVMNRVKKRRIMSQGNDMREAYRRQTGNPPPAKLSGRRSPDGSWAFDN